MTDKYSTVFFVLAGLSMSVSVLILANVYGQLPDKEEIDKTLSETDTRKSFGYCPITDSKNILDSLGITYTTESCPLARIYVDGWDKISSEDKEAIVIFLLERGYTMENE